MKLTLVVGLCITNALLIKQNRDLKAAIAHFVKQPEFLKAGDDVPPLVGRTVEGERVEVNYTESPKTVLLVFSPQCSACEQVLSYWREIEDACARTQYRVFRVSLGDGPSTVAFLRSHSLSLDSFVDLAPETTAVYKLSLTPLTLVIDNRGKVERLWPGVFTRETRGEVERYFGITLRSDAQ